MKESYKIKNNFEKQKVILATFKVPSSTLTQSSSINPSLLAKEIDFENSKMHYTKDSNNDGPIRDKFHNYFMDKLFDLLFTKARTSSNRKKMKKYTPKTNV